MSPKAGDWWFTQEVGVMFGPAATSTTHKELGNQSGGEDFVLRFVPKQGYDVRHGHRHPRLDPTGHRQRAGGPAQKTPDKLPAAGERDVAERSRRRRHGR